MGRGLPPSPCCGAGWRVGWDGSQALEGVMEKQKENSSPAGLGLAEVQRG